MRVGSGPLERQLTLQADVRPEDHFTFGVTFTAFFTGRFLRETGAGLGSIAVHRLSTRHIAF